MLKYFKKVQTDALNKDGKPKIPPGQYVTEKFPVLTYGPTPGIKTVEWQFRLFGLVEAEKTLDWAAFMALPQTEVEADFHCVTTWSKLDNVWRGVKLTDVLALVTLPDEATFVLQHAYGGYTTNTPLEMLLDDDVLLAHTHNGEPLSAEHGGPCRMIIPKRYAWKGAKWINGMEFMAKDKIGFWERNGYSNTADPWLEERYW